MACLRKSEDLRHTRCAMEQSPNHLLEAPRRGRGASSLSVGPHYCFMRMAKNAQSLPTRPNCHVSDSRNAHYGLTLTFRGLDSWHGILMRPRRIVSGNFWLEPRKVTMNHIMCGIADQPQLANAHTSHFIGKRFIRWLHCW